MHRRPSARRAPLATLVCLAVAALPAAARGAAPAPSVASGAISAGATAAPATANRLVDVRLAERDRAAASGADTGLAARSPQTADRVDDARAALTTSLGAQAVLDVDPLTGSVRQLARLDGALTTPTGTAPATTARDFAHANATALGLAPSDVDALQLAGQQHSTSGLTVVDFAQQVDGIPAFDSGLRVAVDHAGRVIQLTGAPRSDLPAAVTTAPPLSAADALHRLMDESGLQRSDVTVTATDADARRTTRFSTGDVARLTLFGATTVHLAWHLTYQASSTVWYDAVVDATTGAVLYRANLVKSATAASVYTNYPGAPAGGTAVPVDLGTLGYLTPGATTLTGPNVHAWADLNDNDLPDAGEEVAPGTYAATTNNNRAAGGCDAQHLCTWNHLPPATPTGNKNQNVTQTFWYANNFHDHLADSTIGFGVASGNFEGSDPLNLNALDGASTGPDADHLDNANMATPPDGQSPKMQMYLFERAPGNLAQNFRDVNGGDDAAILYHEYTHGLSSRLVTDDDGSEALNRPQSGAMGEGWSDWYAQDYLVRENLETDTPGTDGDIDMGQYTDSVRHSLRTQAIDCAVGSTNAAACPGNARLPTGGYTYGDFGKVANGPEVHSDGEIWVQTLWQLRQALVAKFGSDDAGSDAAERIITDAMRLSVPEPTYLDMRNAILAADGNAFGGADHDLIWQVFASRGMGFYAAADDSSDTHPVQDFSLPPAAGSTPGKIAGAVTDQRTGTPLPNATAGVVGLETAGSTPETDLTATSDAQGRYEIPRVPAGTYPRVEVRSPAGYDRLVQPATVVANQSTTLNALLVRDWAASAGGATIATNDDSGALFGCGGAALVDQSQSFGWSPRNSATAAPTLTVHLPQAIDVSHYTIDPSNTCGDDATAALKGYRLETSPDGVTWTLSNASQFAATDAGRFNSVTPAAAAATNVRFVRLTLLSPQSAAAGTSGAGFIDVTEMEVYGAPTPIAPPPATGGSSGGGGTATPPATTPTPTPPPTPTPAPLLARPTLTLPRTGTKGHAKIKVTCKTTCRATTSMTVDAATKRRYKLRYATVGRLTTTTVKGTKTLTPTLTADARKRLRARHAKQLRVTVHVTAILTAATTRRTTQARGATLTL